eukprot:TRINITY_DN3890_c0_g1_i1.p1 TRINITY_DN3890_c0_g1~~TRINITY_DN3890_c0_g1_i1.p1  ORF type:complete len:1038 (-),score=223.93 TRINITY_DN3890_c0_g1_i1:75-3188(-)
MAPKKRGGPAAPKAACVPSAQAPRDDPEVAQAAKRLKPQAGSTEGANRKVTCVQTGVVGRINSRHGDLGARLRGRLEAKAAAAARATSASDNTATASSSSRRPPAHKAAGRRGNSDKVEDDCVADHDSDDNASTSKKMRATSATSAADSSSLAAPLGDDIWAAVFPDTARRSVTSSPAGAGASPGDSEDEGLSAAKRARHDPPEVEEATRQCEAGLSLRERLQLRRKDKQMDGPTPAPHRVATPLRKSSMLTSLSRSCASDEDEEADEQGGVQGGISRTPPASFLGEATKRGASRKAYQTLDPLSASPIFASGACPSSSRRTSMSPCASSVAIDALQRAEASGNVTSCRGKAVFGGQEAPGRSDASDGSDGEEDEGGPRRLRDQDYRVGDRVRVRDVDSDPWMRGEVASVEPQLRIRLESCDGGSSDDGFVFGYVELVERVRVARSAEPAAAAHEDAAAQEKGGEGSDEELSPPAASCGNDEEARRAASLASLFGAGGDSMGSRVGRRRSLARLGTDESLGDRERQGLQGVDSASTGTVKDLKSVLAAHKIDFSACVEKADLQKLWLRFQHLLTKPLQELRALCADARADGSASVPSAGTAEDCARYLCSASVRSSAANPKQWRSTEPTSGNGRRVSVASAESRFLAAPTPAVSSSAPAFPSKAGDREQSAAEEVARILPLRKDSYSTHAGWGFAVLRVPGGSADSHSVQSAYRTLMKKLHPDRAGHSAELAQAIELLREAKDHCERALSRVEPPGAPRHLISKTLCAAPGRRRISLEWSAPADLRSAAPVRKYLVAAVDPAYGRALTVATLEPDYQEDLGRYVSVEELRAITLAEEALQKMPSLFRQSAATFQVAAANEAGLSPWATIQVQLTEERKPAAAPANVAAAAAAMAAAFRPGGVRELDAAARLQEKKPASAPAVAASAPQAHSGSSGSKTSGSSGTPAATAPGSSSIAKSETEFDTQLLQMFKRGAPRLRAWLGRQNKALMVAWLKSRSCSTGGSKEALMERIEEFVVSGRPTGNGGRKAGSKPASACA